MNVKLSVLLGAFLMLSASPLVASDSSEFVERLIALNGFSADFEQTVKDANGVAIQQVSGTMTVAKPGYIHWHSAPPFEQLLIVDGKTMWFYDPDLEQVTVQPYQENIAQTPAMLFTGDMADFERQYNVAKLAKEGNVYRLEPKSSEMMFDSVTLTWSGDHLSAMELEDQLGQRTTVTFSNFVANPPLDLTRFNFEIPQGVDIITNE